MEEEGERATPIAVCDSDGVCIHWQWFQWSAAEFLPVAQRLALRAQARLHREEEENPAVCIHS